jgi:hypothetical protein
MLFSGINLITIPASELQFIHHLRTPGIISSSPVSPPDCHLLFTDLTGEFLMKVGPLETGLGKAGVETLFGLRLTLQGIENTLISEDCRVLFLALC